MKAWFKSKTADKLLSPVREAIIDCIKTHSKLLDVGCGTGDLLFRAAHKISYGLGVDLDPTMIRFANEKKEKLKTHNLEFIQKKIQAFTQLSKYKIDVATSTLCLHEMKVYEAVNTLHILANISSKIIIADYSNAKSFWAKVTIEFDEMISGHYGRFLKYRKQGYIPYLVDTAGLHINSIKETPIDGILLWELHTTRYPYKHFKT